MVNGLHVWGDKKTELIFDRFKYPTDGHPFGYEPEVISAIEHFAEPGDVCIDAGASVGFHTCLMAKLVGEEGVVFAFEPQAESFKYLMQHVHISNKLNNVACVKQGLWKEDADRLELWSAVPHLGYASLYKFNGKEPVACEFIEVRAIDNLFGPEDQPRIMKIDCEGAEFEILSGGEKMLRRGIDCIILELNYFIMSYSSRNDGLVRDYMHSLGYDMFLINIGESGKLVPPIKVHPDVRIDLKGGHSINVLFSTEEKVKDRWRINDILSCSKQSVLN